MPPRDSTPSPRTWIPCLFTASSLAAAFVALILAATNRFDAAVYMLVLAIIFDTLDGNVARWLGATSEFGRELDSFADVIGGGAAPALLIYLAILRPLGVAGIVVTVAYVLAGVFRLARFNLVSDAHTKDRRTLGLPIPIAASYLMAAVLMRDQLSPIVAAGLTLLAALGMMSHIRLPALTGKSIVTAMLGLGMVNYIVCVAVPNWYTMGWWMLWNLIIVAAAVAEDFHGKRVRGRVVT